MNFQEREDQNNFIESLPVGLWLYLVQLCSTTLDFIHQKSLNIILIAMLAFFGFIKR
jgi:hypothetical protein